MTRRDALIAVFAGLGAAITLILAVGPGTFFTGVALVAGALLGLGVIAWWIARNQ
jgi:hypothetical protein